jgi:hypothetical protein
MFAETAAKAVMDELRTAFNHSEYPQQQVIEDRLRDELVEFIAKYKVNWIEMDDEPES